MLSRLRQFIAYKRLKALIHQHEQLLMPALLVFGFAADVVTFRTLSPQTTLIINGIYVTIAGLAITYKNIFDARLEKPTHPILNYLRLSTSFLIQFTFGALLSSSLLFYWFSGAFSISWPIMIVLVALMITTEVFREFYLRPAIQLAVYTFAIFSYFTVLFPFVFRSLSPATFVIGGAVSALIVLSMIVIMAANQSIINRSVSQLAVTTLAIFAVMNGLYFANIIPPIPLFIRDAGVYHDLKVVAGQYQLSGETESQSLLTNLWPNQVVHHDDDGRIYVYTAIFAPTDLKTTIYHQWEYYDPSQRTWVLSSRPSFNIIGGRQEGYRGYSFKTNIQPGEWRVTVETGRGQVLGRVGFRYE